MDRIGKNKCLLTQLGGLFIENPPCGLTRRNSSSSPLYNADKIFIRSATYPNPLQPQRVTSSSHSQVSHFVISVQELCWAVKDISSPPPQPEDPERFLDPTSQEDPDISVELIDGVFHQLSIDNALVAITSGYPGILPAS